MFLKHKGLHPVKRPSSNTEWGWSPTYALITAPGYPDLEWPLSQETRHLFLNTKAPSALSNFCWSCIGPQGYIFANWPVQKGHLSLICTKALYGLALILTWKNFSFDPHFNDIYFEIVILYFNHRSKGPNFKSLNLVLVYELFKDRDLLFLVSEFPQCLGYWLAYSTISSW